MEQGVFIIKWSSPEYQNHAKAFTTIADIEMFMTEKNGFDQEQRNIAVDMWFGLKKLTKKKNYIFDGFHTGISFHIKEV